MRHDRSWPTKKKICATFTVAFEALHQGGHFKKTKGDEVNLVRPPMPNYGGNAGIGASSRSPIERNQMRVTIDVNGLRCKKKRARGG